MRAACTGLLAVLALAALHGAAAQTTQTTYAPEVGDGWRRGRATFFGGDERFLSNFPDRGPPPEYGFGNIRYGSCGYYQQDGRTNVTYGNQVYPINAMAALANNDPDYPGSCGRCYELRCRSLPVIANGTTPYSLSGTYQLAAQAPNAVDEHGRHWPGNPLYDQNEQMTRCWNTTDGGEETIIVHISDMCPCLQREDSARPERVTGVNTPCCGDIYHFDLSYWAFERLAHPLYGIMMLDFRPVDCATHETLNFLPGFVNQTLYGDRVESGWSFEPYRQSYSSFWSPWSGVDGHNATCQATGPDGGLTLACRECDRAGYRPFAQPGARGALEFWTAPTPDMPQGIPALTVTVGNKENREFCSSFNTTAIAPVDRRGPYFKFSLPLAAFQCPRGYGLDRMNQVTFASNARGNVSYCLSMIQLVANPADGSSLTTPLPATSASGASFGTPVAAPAAAPITDPVTRNAGAAAAVPQVMDAAPARGPVDPERTTVRANAGGGVDDYQYSPVAVQQPPVQWAGPQAADAGQGNGGEAYQQGPPRRPRRRPAPGDF